MVAMRSGRFAEAEAATRRTLDISPNYGSARYQNGLAMLLQGRTQEAYRVMQDVSPDDGQFEGLAVVYSAMGRKKESDAALKRALEIDSEDWAYGIASVYAYRGEHDLAMRWLDRAYAHRDSNMYTIKGDPLLHNIEGDPGYKEILRKMNLPE
jgi:tetratricopeptide (TPR) repeat protein